MKTVNFRVAFVFLFFVIGITANGKAVEQDAGKDKILQLLDKELQGHYKSLQDSLYKPYYMNFRVSDVTTMNISATLGTLADFSSQRNIWFVPQIRIGSEEFDNFHDWQNGAPSSMQQPPAPVFLPLNYEQSEESVKDIIRKEVASRYKFAIGALESAKTRTAAGNGNRDTTGDFSVASAELYYEAMPEKASFSKSGAELFLTTTNDASSYLGEKAELWKNKVKELSALFLSNGDVVNASVTLNYEFRRRYFVSTEGASVAENRPYIMLSVHANGVAPDGMTLPLHKGYSAFEFDELPDNSVIVKDIKEMSSKISRLVKAPVVQPYAGPALLSGSAAGVFFHEIFGHRIEGQRLKSDFDGQTFKHMTGENVLPANLSVTDDPSLKYFEGTPLHGYYLFDDQGVRGQKAEVVKDGKLKNFLMSRTPINGHFKSNGHARADFVNDPTSRQANLIIKTSDPYNEKQMRELFVKEILSSGKEFGFYFKEVTGGFTQISSMAVNSFNVLPLEVYKVYADGREDELVRGVDMIGTPLSMFSNIVCAGGKYEVFTGQCGAASGNIPVTAVAPAVLVSKVELQSKPKSTATPPILQRNGVEEVSNTKDDKFSTSDERAIFEAMRQELERSLKLPGDNQTSGSNSSALPPYYILYTLGENRSANASAVKGGVVTSNYLPARRYTSVNLYVGDSAFSSDYSYTGSAMVAPVLAPLENDITAIRNAFWYNTDMAYKFAADVYNSKKNNIKSAALTEEEKELPDMLPLTEVNREPQGKSLRRLTPESEKQCRELAVKLSLLFNKYPDLSTSRINVSHMQSIYYVVGNEGTRVKVPVEICYVNMSGSVELGKDQVVQDFENIAAGSFEELPSYKELENRVMQFAERLVALKNAQKMTEYYYGPVLFENYAVSSIFLNNLAGDAGLFAFRKPVQVSSTVAATEDVSGRISMIPLERRMGERIIDPSLNIYNKTDVSAFEGNNLIGAYEMDIQGVRPIKNLELVRNGVLTNVMSNRVPTLNSKQSTGSMRAGIRDNSMSVALAPGTLVIEAPDGNTPEKIKKELLKRAKAQGVDYAYIVRKFNGGSNQVIYRVSVKNGTETPVTGAQIPGIPFPKLSNIGPDGISKEQTYENTMFRGTVPMSVIFPRSLLLNNIEINTSR